MSDIAHILKDHGLRMTEVRKSVLSLFLDSESALSQSEIDAQFEELDRVTLYRTLKTFESKGLVHKISNDQGHISYALCSHDCGENKHEDTHPHFQCDKCDKVFCLDEVNLPKIKAPDGFEVRASKIMAQGLCKDCN